MFQSKYVHIIAVYGDYFGIWAQNRLKMSILIVFPIVGFEEMECDNDFIVNGILNGHGHCWDTNW